MFMRWHKKSARGNSSRQLASSQRKAAGMIIGESREGVAGGHLNRVRHPAVKKMRVRIELFSLRILLPPKKSRQFLGGQDARDSQECFDIALCNQNIVFGINKEVVGVFSVGK